MTRAAINHCLGLTALLLIALGVAAPSAQATTIGLLPAGASYSDTISSGGPTFNRDYSFSLDGSTTGLTLLATAIGQSSASYGVDLLEISLYDSASHLIATATGAPVAGFDSFAQSGLALGAGAYLFTVFGQVTAGKQAFVSISLAANSVSTPPIPAAGLLLLTGLGALGGIGWHRHARNRAVTPVA